MNHLTSVSTSHRGVFQRLFTVFILSVGLVATITYLLFNPAQAGVRVEISPAGYLIVHPGQLDALALHMDYTPDTIHISSPVGVSFDGRTRQTIQIPASTFAGKEVHFTFGQAEHHLIATLDGDTDLSLGHDRAGFSLDATGNLHLSSVSLDKPLSIRMMGESHDVLTLGAVTAESLTISGGEVKVDAPVSVPLGFNSHSTSFTLNPQGRIDSIAGDVNIQAQEQLQLLESQVRVAGALRLNAGDALVIRDSDERPFIAQAGKLLQFQGYQLIDISALAHPASMIASGGDMWLRSARPVRGDALYLSGGAFHVLQPDGRTGDLISPYDPIILADGDVSLGSYTGASLHIVAGGSVMMSSAVITGTDTTANTINATNTMPFNGSDTIADLADLTLSSGTPIAIDGSARAVLDVRAGVDWTTFVGPPGDQIIPPGAVAPTFAPASSASIAVTGGITITPPGGLVLLTNQYRPNAGLTGSISSGNINASTDLLAQDGGSIVVDSRGDIATGGLDAFAEVFGIGVTAGNAGTITLLAPNGSVSAGGDVNAFARTPANNSGSVGNGGDILITAANGITVNNGSGNVNAFAFSNSDGDAGNGGHITLTTLNGDITARTLNSYSFAITTGATGGDGGDIVMSTGDGRITVAGDGFFTTLQSYALSGDLGGDGGHITLTATQGIDIGQSVRTFASGEGGNGGDVHMMTTNGDITSGDIIAQAIDNNPPGSGGDVTLQALNGGVSTGDILSLSDAFVINGDSQDGGDIVVQALGGDATMGELLSYSEARGLEGDTGNAGSITIIASGSITATGNVQAYALAAANNGNSGVAGNAGDVTLQATGTISAAGSVDAYSSATGQNGTAANGGDIIITANSGYIEMAGDVNAYASAIGFPSGDAGNSGSITLVAGGGINVNGGDGSLNAYSTSNEGSVGNGGDIAAATTSGDITIESANSSARNQFADNSISTGNGGNILLDTGNGRIVVNPDDIFVFNALNSESAGADVTGNSGDIVVTATQGISISGIVRALASGASGNGGDVHLVTSGGDITTDDIFAAAIDNDDAPGSSGDVVVLALDGGVSVGDVLAYSLALLINNDAQDGGDITITALNGDATTGALQSYAEARGLDGDTGNAGSIIVIASGSITATADVETYALASINNNASGIAGNAGDVSMQATGTISIAGGIDTSSAAPGPNGISANAGDATLLAGGDVQLASIDARSHAATANIGAGGTVNISTTQVVRLEGTLSGGLFGISNTIATVGLPGSSAITITHGGSGVTPFVVGDASLNGTFEPLNTGDAIISPTQSFLYSYHETPNIWIISVPVPLTITKSANPDTDVAYHGEITYTLMLSNPAQFDAVGVFLTDTLPVEVDFNRWLQQPVGAAVAGDVLTWSGDVPANSAITFAFVVDHVGDAGDVFTNTAEFAHPSSLGSGSASATVSIEAASNLSIEKTAVPNAALPGETIQYVLTFANAGPGVARNVIITDVVPAELTNLTVANSGATVTPIGGETFAWAVQDLAVGQGGVITITGELVVPLARDLVIANTAVIAATTIEADAGDNEDTVNVTVLNAAPQSVDDTAITDEDTAVNVPVLANDSDLNGDSLSLLAVGTPGNGVAVINGDTIDYTPLPDFNGTDTFTYTVGDGLLASSALVTVTVNPINDAPVAVDNVYITAEDTPLTVLAAAGVLSNDTDMDGDSLEAVLVDDVLSGALSLAADGGFTYTPALNFTGPVTFTYQATDDLELSSIATVTITVGAENDPPSAVDDTATTNEDTAVTIDVLFNDSDPDGDTLAVISVGNAANGATAINANMVAYTPALNFNGTDVFTYTVGDGLLASTALVTVTVAPINDAPVAIDNTYNTAEDTPLTIIAVAGVLSNDTDVDGDSLQAVLVDDVASGVLSLGVDGGFTYTPALNFTGLVIFTYQAADGLALSNLATVTITVGAENDPPSALDNLTVTDEDTAVTIDVLFNDSDPDGDTLAVISVGTAANGATAINANMVDYTPALNFNGTDVFTYTVSDGQLNATAAITVTVNPINDQPQFASTPVTVAVADAPYTYTVTADDVDFGSQLAINALVLPSWLTIVDQGGGTAVLSGTPADTDVGDHLVTLVVSDGGLDDSQSFTITVNPAPIQYVYLPVIIQGDTTPVLPPDLVVTDLIVASDAITVVIQNVGSGPTVNSFWVDVYVNPSEPPSLNKTWQLIAEEGIAWGVTDPIPAGSILTLTIGDAYYVATESEFNGLVAGDEVWAQVDAVNLATTYGNVLENDETNNVSGPVEMVP